MISLFPHPRNNRFSSARSTEYRSRNVENQSSPEARRRPSISNRPQPHFNSENSQLTLSGERASLNTSFT